MAKKSKAVSNCENAKKSTGPKTKIGKSIVSKNALRHGIFAKEAVITGGDGAEDQREFDALLPGLIEYYQPEGMQEMLLVEKIAVDNWRLKRLVRFENGVLRRDLHDFKQLTLDEHYAKSQDNSFEFGSMSSARLKPKMEYFSCEHQFSENELDAEICRYSKISSNEEALKADKFFLQRILAMELDIDVIEFDSETIQKATDFLTQCSSKKFNEIRDDFLKEEKRIIDEMRAIMLWRKCLEFEERVRQLPAEKEIDKIIKYEIHLERVITKNISLLLTLQQKRLARNFKEIKTRLN